jgi:hypothetical protein
MRSDAAPGFAFAVKSADGAPLAASAPAPAGSSRMVSRALAPKETYDFVFKAVVPAGQMLAPGRYDQTFQLSLTGAAGAVPPPGVPPLQTASLTLSLEVRDYLGVNIAGGGAATTIDFGTLTAGASRRVILAARSNRKFTLLVSSLKGGALVMAPPYERWRIPYTMSLNGAPVAMPAARPVPDHQHRRRTLRGGVQHRRCVGEARRAVHGRDHRRDQTSILT